MEALQVGSPLRQNKAVRERPLALGVIPAAANVLSTSSSLSETPLTAAPYCVAVRVPALAIIAALLPPMARRRALNRRRPGNTLLESLAANSRVAVLRALPATRQVNPQRRRGAGWGGADAIQRFAKALGQAVRAGNDSGLFMRNIAF